jgi:hypothetical protein
MKKPVFLILLLFALIAQAQVFSPMQLISESPDKPLIVLNSDLNNDGYQDVVYSSTGDNEISCSFFNPETGSFDDPVLLGTQFPYCTSLFCADLDNNGLIDVLAVSQTTNKVGWYKNNGNGSFSVQPLINGDAPLAASVTASDVDSDGDYDVISAQKGDNTLLLYLNDGNGSFSTPNVITSSAQIPVVVTSCDLNNDTFPDVIAGYGQSDKVVFFINNGDGTFQPEVTVTSQADYITTIITADIDSDGNTDIISSSKNDNKVAWYRNLDGNGNFSEQIVISETITAAFGLATGDFDLDGDPDIVTTSPNDNLIVLFKNQNTEFQSFIISSEVKEPKGVASADFNNDGLPDIVSVDAWSSGYTNMIYWFINGKGGFRVHNINKSISSWHLAMNDYDYDGDQDIFYCDGQKICIVNNENPGGTFGPEIVLYDNGYNIYEMRFADANNDGYDDLFVVDAMGDMFFWFKNINGSGQFDDPVFIDTQGDGPVAMDFADIDGDGNTDALVALANGNKIALYFNDGNGGFSKTIVANAINSPASISFSDFNNDGDKDIIYSDNTGISILENDGNGSFTSYGEIINYGTYSGRISVADLNNDGFDDVVCNPGYVHWLINNQDGTFTDHELETWGGSYYVETSDLDNDGNIDILSPSGMVNRAYYLRNTGVNDVFEINTYAVDPDIRAVCAGDINNDGYDDFVIGSWPSENLSWAENFLFRIIYQPSGDSACIGGEALFSVVTAGVTEFQWQINDGNGWANLENSAVFDGVTTALLKISAVTDDLFGSEFRCAVKDELNNTLFTEPALLLQYQPSVNCIDDQVRTAGISNTYIVQENEFDPDTIVNPCNNELTLVNDYNNLETLAGEVFTPGSYTIVWSIFNSDNVLIDSCSFNLEIDSYTNVYPLTGNEIRIFPNPSNGFIIVTLSGKISAAQIKVTDISGMVVLEKEIKGRKTKIDLSEYNPGVYTITVISEETVFTGKIIKK